MHEKLEWKPRDYHLHDRKIAVQRIAERPKDYYDVKSIEDLQLREADFRLAHEVCQAEAEIVHAGTNIITREGLNRGIAYCLLTPMQNYSGQINGFNSIAYDPNMPLESMSQQDIYDRLKSVNVILPKQKSKYIFDAIQTTENCSWDLPTLIGDNLHYDRKVELTLRDLISGEVKGLGPKTTTILLRMCGAKHLVPIDSWMMEMLYFSGYPCEMPRKVIKKMKWQSDEMGEKLRKVGLSPESHIRAEEYALDLAEKYGVPGYILQAAFYAKKSSYGKHRLQSTSPLSEIAN